MAVINLVTAILSGVYFFKRKAVNVECERKEPERKEGGIFKAPTRKFSIFTIEDKLLAKSGSIATIEN